MGHVFARLSGHGLVLVPHWPYTFERADAASDAVMVTNWRADGPAKALVDPADAHGVPGVVDVEAGPDHPFWVIETSGFNAAWPPGFNVESTVDPYCLVGEHEASIFVQGPAHVPDPDAMIAPGQTVVARREMDSGVRVVEAAYEHEGEAWWQGIYLYPREDGRVLVFTAQSREPGVAAARHGLEWMLGLA
ncbi:hypothetical protein [Actinoplanes regularis]|uniref:Uncharacterized protein n=1 Tax=Actinoplanes regularis TaxID=52697 RepID=A0A239IZS7_9ACTN|nr:hypothetical protein [Actinoplanes regularis]GIE91935.1 hypothetical protein Are01nite_84150 [Actinoplanes regularis]SNS99090.1 hypothetical protein SAMN06264365_1321 [Actinoplanes regularis]